jgi:predicted unusual protein kinase regulating ubiquinone biosynthesis (AarF/ABC1/UbiB family)
MTNPSIHDLRSQILSQEQSVTHSGLRRLWKSARTAATMGKAVLGSRWRSAEAGWEPSDLRAWLPLVTQLGELKGVAMKAGQMMGYVDPSLAGELRDVLSLLQTAAPSSPWSEVEQSIQEALGEQAPMLLAAMERTPIAVASMGQVYKATLDDNTKIAVKVRHRGIEAAIRSDFAAAGTGTALATMFAPGATKSIKSFVNEAEQAFLGECDFASEAHHQHSFRIWLQDVQGVRVPKPLLPWCSEAVMVSEWLPGMTLDQWLEGNPSQRMRNRVGEVLFRCYIGTLYRHGWLHADPHPGNFAFTKEGEVILYDFGCVRYFKPAMRTLLANLAQAVRCNQRNRMAEILVEMGCSFPKKARGQEHVWQLMSGFFAPIMTPGVHKLDGDVAWEARSLLADKKRLMELELPGELLFLFRLRFGLYAILARLESEVDWASLESELADSLFPTPSTTLAASENV